MYTVGFFECGYIVIPYFIALILFGSFFPVNLALAVIWQEYEKKPREKEHDQLKMMARNARESEEEKTRLKRKT